MVSPHPRNKMGKCMLDIYTIGMGEEELAIKCYYGFYWNIFFFILGSHSSYFDPFLYNLMPFKRFSYKFLVIEFSIWFCSVCECVYVCVSVWGVLQKKLTNKNHILLKNFRNFGFWLLLSNKLNWPFCLEYLLFNNTGYTYVCVYGTMI